MSRESRHTQLPTRDKLWRSVPRGQWSRDLNAGRTEKVDEREISRREPGAQNL